MLSTRHDATWRDMTQENTINIWHTRWWEQVPGSRWGVSRPRIASNYSQNLSCSKTIAHPSTPVKNVHFNFNPKWKGRAVKFGLHETKFRSDLFCGDSGCISKLLLNFNYCQTSFSKYQVRLYRCFSCRYKVWLWPHTNNFNVTLIKLHWGIQGLFFGNLETSPLQR